MNHNKQVLKHCPNFYKIVNFNYYEGDTITEKLLSIYEDYIFSIDVNNIEDLKNIEELDRVVSKYIDDCVFRRDLKYNLTQIRVSKSEGNILEQIVSKILSACHLYEESGLTTKIYISRWI